MIFVHFHYSEVEIPVYGNQDVHIRPNGKTDVEKRLSISLIV